MTEPRIEQAPQPTRKNVVGFAVGVAGIAATVATIAIFVLLTVHGAFPRMRNQQSIRALEAPMAPLPQGVVPFTGGEPYVPDEDVADLVNPVVAGPVNEAVGARYYAMYCGFCHGADGRGNTPVGAGYIPAPADLSSPLMSEKSDGEVFSAMVTGAGHDEVIRATVLPERRWYIVRHLRTLAR